MFFVPQTLGQTIALVMQILVIFIFAEAIISNIIAFGGKLSPYHPVVKFIRRVVNPILNPLRQMLPPWKTGGWDLSPLIAMVILQVIENVVIRY